MKFLFFSIFSFFYFFFVLTFFFLLSSFFFLLCFDFVDGTVWSQAVSLSPGEQVNQIMKSWYYMWQACKKKIQSIKKNLFHGIIIFKNEEETDEEKIKIEEEVSVNI